MQHQQLKYMKILYFIDRASRYNSLLMTSSLLTSIPSSHSHILIIPHDVLIQFDLLMMSTVMLQTCREV